MNSKQEQKEWLTTKDLFEELDFSISRQAALRSQGKLPFHRIGKYIRYNHKDINEWLNSYKVV